MICLGEPAAPAADLLAILACPACDERPGVELSADGRYLVCTVCRLRYPLMPGGIPVLLVEEALPPEGAEAPGATAAP